MAAEAEAEPTAEETASFDVSVHEIDLAPSKPRDEASGGRVVDELLVGNAEVAIEPHTAAEEDARTAWIALTLELVDSETDCLQKAPTRDDRLAPRASERVSLGGRLGVDLGLHGMRTGREKANYREEGEAEPITFHVSLRQVGARTGSRTVQGFRMDVMAKNIFRQASRCQLSGAIAWLAGIRLAEAAFRTTDKRVLP